MQFNVICNEKSCNFKCPECRESIPIPKNAIEKDTIHCCKIRCYRVKEIIN